MVTKEGALGFLQSQSADRAATYAAGGREHARLSVEELQGQWVAAFRAMAADATDADLWSIHSDLDSEFILRGIEPPYSLVKDDLERFITSVDALVREQKQTDPDGHREANGRLLADFEAFEERRNKGS
jgi:hypothetical protein